MSATKLVRDRIPEIMRAKGLEPKTRILADDAEYARFLRAKLREESEEFFATPNAEEAADIQEVLLALWRHYGIDPAEVERVRLDKLDRRGGFSSRTLLEGK